MEKSESGTGPSKAAPAAAPVQQSSRTSPISVEGWEAFVEGLRTLPGRMLAGSDAR